MRACAAVALAATVLLASGCGGAESDARESASGDRLTKSEFLARGDAICADAQAELGQIEQRADRAREMPRGTQAGELAAIWHKQLDIAERFKARFEALRPPVNDEERFREFIRALDDGVELSREIVGYLDDRREPPRQLMVDYSLAVYRGNALAQRYGFEVCGRS